MKKIAYHIGVKIYKQCSGETLAETLVSILISSLAFILLATAIGSSVRIVLSSKDTMETIYDSENKTLEMLADYKTGGEYDSSTNLTTTVALSPNSATIGKDSEGNDIYIAAEVTLFNAESVENEEGVSITIPESNRVTLYTRKR